MSSINLLILGILKKKSMSAYDLTKYVESMKMKKWIKIGSPTIYQNIKKLAYKKFLSTKKIKVGEMPDKTIYTITSEGEAYFFQLMEKISNDPGKIYFNYNVFIANLNNVKKEKGLILLNNLKKYFYNGKADVESDMNSLKNIPLEGQAIMKQYQILYENMISWINDFIKKYNSK